ncbi:MAG TPA: hypothetical protein VM366_09000 [Anaerolineae bacterium]|nr:hypothetical protein [Anaerolineae bacterium]
MKLLARLITQYALWIYILCAFGIVLYLRAALSARREGSQAIYSLERETAAKRVYRAAGMIMAIIVVVVAVYVLSHYVELPQPTTSPIELSTQTPEETEAAEPASPPTPGEALPSPEPTPTRRPQVTIVAIPTLVQETPSPPPASASCPHSNVQVFQPRPNAVVNQGVQVLGTANKEDFDRYEFKFQSRDFEDEWHWVETFRTPVENSDLGWWQTAHLPNGNYRFMLIAIDRMGNSQECVVPVVIQH